MSMPDEVCTFRDEMTREALTPLPDMCEERLRAEYPVLVVALQQIILRLRAADAAARTRLDDEIIEIACLALPSRYLHITARACVAQRVASSAVPTTDD